MPSELSRSKRPLSKISCRVKTMSRNTADNNSRVPRIIVPSTNASAGALLNETFRPRSCCRNATSKSRYASRTSLALSDLLPEFNTASMQRLSSGYRPPVPLLFNRSTSSWERTSRLPSGHTSASTQAGESVITQGRISIGTLSPVISQISIMSEFETAIQPLVQSCVL